MNTIDKVKMNAANAGRKYLSNEQVFSLLDIHPCRTPDRKKIYKTEDEHTYIIRCNTVSSDVKYFWYGIQSSLSDYRVDTCILVTGMLGFYAVPFDIIRNLMLTDSISQTADGSEYKLVIEKINGEMHIRTLKYAPVGNISIEKYFYECKG